MTSIILPQICEDGRLRVMEKSEITARSYGESTYTVTVPCVTYEQAEIMAAFTDLLNQASQDGGRKRARGEKVDWHVDRGHAAAMCRHYLRWESGDTEDRDSGAHPLVHAAWRALAIAWQETHEIGDEDARAV